MDDMPKVLKIIDTVMECMRNPFVPTVAAEKLVNIAKGEIFTSSDVVDSKQLGLDVIAHARSTDAEKIISPKILTFAGQQKQTKKRQDSVKQIVSEEGTVTRALCFTRELTEEDKAGYKMRKGNKADFLDTLQNKVSDTWKPLEELPPSALTPVYVIDAMTSVQRFQTLGDSKFNQLQERYKDKIMKMKPMKPKMKPSVPSNRAIKKGALKYSVKCSQETLGSFGIICLIGVIRWILVIFGAGISPANGKNDLPDDYSISLFSLERLTFPDLTFPSLYLQKVREVAGDVRGAGSQPSQEQSLSSYVFEYRNKTYPKTGKIVPIPDLGLRGALQSCFFTIASTRIEHPSNILSCNHNKPIQDRFLLLQGELSRYKLNADHQFHQYFHKRNIHTGAVLPVVWVAVYCALLRVDELSKLVDALLSSPHANSPCQQPMPDSRLGRDEYQYADSMSIGISHYKGSGESFDISIITNMPERGKRKIDLQQEKDKSVSAFPTSTACAFLHSSCDATLQLTNCDVAVINAAYFNLHLPTLYLANKGGQMNILKLYKPLDTTKLRRTLHLGYLLRLDLVQHNKQLRGILLKENKDKDKNGKKKSRKGHGKSSKSVRVPVKALEGIDLGIHREAGAKMFDPLTTGFSDLWRALERHFTETSQKIFEIREALLQKKYMKFSIKFLQELMLANFEAHREIHVLDISQDSIGEYLKKRLNKNKDLEDIFKITRDSISPALYDELQCCHPTSAAVERSVSMLGNYLRRTDLSCLPANVEKKTGLRQEYVFGEHVLKTRNISISDRPERICFSGIQYSSSLSAAESSTLMTTDDGTMSSSSTSNNYGVVLLQV
ncbi:hypothetical protein GQR58_008489 [Nymphon striatum]|nr:hypothetical protein GQR58_008489 [Nymphon striatum]